MVFRLTFSTVIQACNVPDVNAKGRPEAKPNRSRMAVLRWVKIVKYCFSMASVFLQSKYK